MNTLKNFAKCLAILAACHAIGFVVGKIIIVITIKVVELCAALIARKENENECFPFLR